MSPDQPLGAPRLAFVRTVPDSYVDCLRQDRVAIDVERARGQWSAYCRALVDAGAELVEIAGDESYPDCCFVEDVAVLLSTRAVVTRPGAPGRVGEVGVVADYLGAHYHLEVMEAPATLDGGDVLRWGRRLFVGLSRRTNRAGIAHLQAVAQKDGFQVEIVPVFNGLHLKSSCTLADEGTLVFREQTLDVGPFRAAGLDCLPVSEPMGANVLALGTFVLVSDAAPRTAEMLNRRGSPVRTVDVGELHKGDGGLTCLCLRMCRAGHWGV